MVQRNGTREESGTRLITLRACTSKNVMPRKPGVSNDLVIAPLSNSAGAAVPGWPPGRPAVVPGGPVVPGVPWAPAPSWAPGRPWDPDPSWAPGPPSASGEPGPAGASG